MGGLGEGYARIWFVYANWDGLRHIRGNDESDILLKQAVLKYRLLKTKEFQGITVYLFSLKSKFVKNENNY